MPHRHMQFMNFYYQVQEMGRLFGIFFKIGLFTIGGGYVMLPVIQRTMVEEKKWIEEEQFLRVIALSQSVPGALAINTAFQVGFRLYGAKGAFFAVLGTALPSFLIILLIASYLMDYRDHPLVISAFQGILPAVVALIVAAAWRLGRNAVKDWKGGGLFLLLLGGGYFLDLHPFIILLVGAVGGTILYREKKDEAP